MEPDQDFGAYAQRLLNNKGSNSLKPSETGTEARQIEAVMQTYIEPTLFTTLPTAEPPGPASTAFCSVSHPHRTVEYASGALGRETPRPQDLSAPRYGTVVNKVGYDELRRNGWPRSRAVVEALEAYHRQADQISKTLKTPPAYRNLVRGLIPLAAHQPYWLNCFRIKDGEEAYLEDCSPGVSPQVAAAGVAAINAHPDIHRTLTEWTGFSSLGPITITGLIEAAKRAIAVIDVELGKKESGNV